ncbi:MAG: DUF4956 domain-containing protein [Lachnospiraceae bacterium]|nr:DUF4956 domain-containing protein [Robinsoniella sp.]MDY3765733.1 DUF4956 domain-containing protein [Lachnospiraceae bacterium]
MLDSILNVSGTADISEGAFFLCTLVSFVLGLALAGIHMYKNHCTKNFIITLIILPAVVQIVIMMVNGNLGTGVAVMGTFGLVRFRSMPGNSREITSVFLAMAVGLATGMGYLALAAVFVVLIGIVLIVFQTIPFPSERQQRKELKITIPENLDYTDLFDDLFEVYAKEVSLVKVKTTNMGSLYELQYEIRMKNEKSEKEMIDALRCRNGNLPIICGHFPENREEL